MPIDTGIWANALRPPKSIADYDAEAQQAKANALGLQGKQVEYQNALQAQQDAMAYRNASRGFGADPTENANTLYKAGLPTQAAAVLKAGLDAKLTTAHAGNLEQQTAASKADQTFKASEQHLQLIPTIQTHDDAVNWAIAHRQIPGSPMAAMPTEQFVAGLSRIPTDPQQLAAWKQQTLQGGMSATEQLKQKQALDIANQSNATSIANNTATNKTHLQTAGIAASTSRANNAANITKDYTLAGIKPDGSPVDGGGLLSPESVVNAATRYNMDGTLPPNLGRGTQGPRQTAQILNEAARQAAVRGDTPETQRIAQLANKSNAVALSKLETQQTMVGAFEKNFTKNADIAQELSNKVDRTGIPLINKWVNAGKRSITGDPDISAFDASVKATVNEYGKIVGGGTGSSATAQGEIAKIEGLLNAAQTPQQVKSVLDLMRRETANRMSAFEDQKAELKGSMIPGKKAPATVAPAASGLPSGWKIEKVGG